LQAKSQCLILKSPGLRKFIIFPLLPDFRYFGKISPTFPSPSPEPPWSQFRKDLRGEQVADPHPARSLGVLRNSRHCHHCHLVRFYPGIK
jgi:hypothetical protein